MPELEQVSSSGLEKLVRKLPDLKRCRVFLAVFLLLALSFVFLYVRVSRKVDQRLAEGPFAASADLFTAPRTLTVGEAVSAHDLAQNLERSGYKRSRNNHAGWFEEFPAAIDIFPGDASGTDGGPARLEFAGGRILRITSLADHAAHEAYRLAPQLIANLSQTRERRRLVHFADIPPCLVEAVLSAEDKHFFHHGGFDLARMLKAAYIDVRQRRKSEGASTLTMQLARGLWLDRAKSWRRKCEEFLITLHLEQKLTKEQIFEDYANQVYLGQHGTFSINGFGEGARVFFGKDIAQLNTAEAALLAGLVRRPASYNPAEYPDRARERRNVVLSLMRHNGYLGEDAYRDAAATPVEVAHEPAGETANGYFIALLNNELRAKFGEEGARNRRIYTTLDPDLQQAAEASVRSGMEYVDQQLYKQRRGAIPGGQPQVALIALDPHTGEIKALVGGRNFTDSQLNHALASRQPGSAFKPLVYAAAIDTALGGGARTFTPASLVSDEATTFTFGDETYQPKDYHGDYQGDVTLRTALAESLNVAAVSLAQQVGYDRIVRLARLAGLNGVKATPSLALGSYEVTPLDLAGAYTVFANHGVWVKPTTIESVRAADGSTLIDQQPVTRQAMDPRVAYITLNMMQEVLRSGTGATARSQGFWLPAAGKTGTSRDGWFAGFTSQLLCVVWVGFDDDRDLKLEGARSALPIWADFMRQAAQISPYRSAHDFRVPSGVVSAQICSDTGELASPLCPNTRNEVFIAGTEPTTVCHEHANLGADANGGQ